METKTSIRPANIHDLPAINDIYNHWVVNSTCTYDDCRSSMDDRKRWFSDHVGGGYPIILAEREGVVLGYGSLSPFRGFRGYRFTVEDSVYVRADAQRQGIGQKLLTELISLARASGVAARRRWLSGVSLRSRRVRGSR